jgi:hypothetical protein
VGPFQKYGVFMMRLMIVGGVLTATLLSAIGCGQSIPPPPTGTVPLPTAKPVIGGAGPGGGAPDKNKSGGAAAD